MFIFKHLDLEYFCNNCNLRELKTKYIKGVATREWVQQENVTKLGIVLFMLISFVSLNADLDKIKSSLEKNQLNKTTTNKN